MSMIEQPTHVVQRSGGLEPVRIIARPSIFRPDDTKHLTVPPELSIAEMARLMVPEIMPGARLVAYHDGRSVPEHLWHARPRAGSIVAFYLVPGEQGGIAQILGTIAVAAATLVAGVFGGPWAAIPTALIGNFALSSLLSAPQQRRGGAEPRPSVITGQQNVFPRGQPVRWVFGEVRMFPPIVGFTTETRGNDLWASNLYVVGLGRLQIDNDKIGDTDLSQFNRQRQAHQGTGVEADFTIFTNDIFEEAVGAAVRSSGTITPVIRTTQAGTDRISVDAVFPRGLFRVRKKGGYDVRHCNITVDYSVAGSGGPWTLVESRLAVANTRQPHRENFTWDVTQGQYDVRITSTSGSDDDLIDDLDFARLRSIKLIGEPIPKDWAAVALRIEHDGSLPSYNVRARSFMPDYDGTPGSWTERITRNPASAYRHLLQGPGNANPQPDSKIDLSKLEEWHDFCVAKGLTFDYVFEDEGTLRERLEVVCRAGLASLARPNGVFSVVIDEDPGAAVNMLTPSNTTGYVAEINHEPPPQALLVRFIDGSDVDVAWQEDEFHFFDAGFDENNMPPPNRIELLDLTQSGIVQYANAYRVAERFLKSRKLRGGESWRVDAGVEAIMHNRGDRVYWQHDVMLQGLQSSRIKSVVTDGGGNVTSVTLEETVEMEAGNSYGLRVRLLDDVGGVGSTSFVDKQAATVAGETTTLDFSGDPFPAANAPQPGDLASFGIVGSETIDAIVMERLPGPTVHETTFVLMRHDPDIYVEGSPGTFTPGITLPADPDNTPPAAPVIEATSLEDLAAPREAAATVRAMLHVLIAQISGRAPAAAAIQGEIRIKDTTAGITGSWQRHILEGGRTRYTFPEPIDRGFKYDIRLRALSKSGRPSDWSSIVEVDATIPGESGLTLAKVTGLQLLRKPQSTTVEGRDFKFVWRRNSVSGTVEIDETDKSGQGFLDPSFSHWLVEISDTVGLRKRREEEVITPAYTYLYGDNVDDSARLDGSGTPPARDVTIRVRVVDTFGRQGLPATLAVSNPAPPAPNVTYTAGIKTILVDAPRPPDPDFRGTIVWASQTSGFQPPDENTKVTEFDGPYAVIGRAPGTWYLRTAHFDDFSKDPEQLNISGETQVNVSDEAAGSLGIKTRFDPAPSFTANDPGADQISWPAMTAHVKNNGGEDTYSIASGNATWTSGTLWIYWVDGQTALSSTTDFPTAMGTDRVVLATYKGGENLVVGEVQVSGHQVDFLKADKLLAESVLAQRIYMGGQTGARLELDGSIPRIDVFSDAVAGVMVRLGRLGTGNDGIVINDSNGDDVMRVDSSGIARFDGVYIQDLTVGRVKASDFAFTANAVDANSGQVFRDEIGYPSPFNEAHEGMSATVEVSSARGTMIWGSAIITVNLQDPDPFIDSSVIRLELRRGGTLLRSWDMEDLPGFVRTDQAGNHRLDGIDVPVDFAVVDPTPGTGNQTYRYLMRFNISAGLVLGEYYVEIVQGDLSVLSAFK